MTIVAYPLDAVSGAPSYTGEMVRQSLSVLAGVAPSGRPLGATSGVRQGTPTTTVTATATTWTIAPHSGCLDVETSATAGPYFYAVRANETGSVTAANATNDRIDIVYLQTNDPAESDGSSTPAVVSGYLAGTPAASPVAPSAPNSRCMILAQIRVPKSGTGSPSVTWVAPTTLASGPLPITDTGWVAVPVGASWVNNGAQMRIINGVVYMRGVISTTSGNFTPSTTLNLISPGGLPVAYRPPSNQVNVILGASNVGVAVRGIINLDGSMQIVTQATTGSYVDLAAFSGYLNN